MTALEVDLDHRVGTFELSAQFSAGGGITALFGPSGAGKSLTLRLIAGLERPARGRIVLGGEVLTDADGDRLVASRHRRLGMVFQDALLLPHRTVLANVAMAVDGDRRRRRQAAQWWLERVGASELAERRPGGLSGGQQQRVALARALAGQPQMLLLDEPLAALDLPVRRRLRALIREIVDGQQVPALLVTHDREEVRTLADAVVLAQDGQVRGPQPPEVALESTDGDPHERET